MMHLMLRPSPAPQPIFMSSPVPYLKSTPKQFYGSTVKPYYGSSTPKPFYGSSTPKLFFGSTPKPLRGHSVTPFLKSTLKPTYGPTKAPAYASTFKPTYPTTKKPSYSPTPTPIYVSTPKPTLLPSYEKPKVSTNRWPPYKPEVKIPAYMPPPVSQDVGGYFSNDLHGLYAPKHGPPSPTSPRPPPKPKSIHFGTHFATSYSGKTKYRYDPTIAPEEISGSKQKATHAPVYASPVPTNYNHYQTTAKVTHFHDSYNVPKQPQQTYVRVTTQSTIQHSPRYHDYSSFLCHPVTGYPVGWIPNIRSAIYPGKPEYRKYNV